MINPDDKAAMVTFREGDLLLVVDGGCPSQLEPGVYASVFNPTQGEEQQTARVPQSNRSSSFALLPNFPISSALDGSISDAVKAFAYAFD